MLTPIDIQKREFKIAIRGYEKKEVDEFMSMIAESLEKRIAELEDAKSQAKQLEVEIKKYRTIENTLSETLVYAKQTSEDIINSAKKREDIITKEAELRAEEIKRKKDIELMNMQKKLDDLNLRFEATKMRIRSFYEMHLQLLDENVPTIEQIKMTELPSSPNAPSEIRAQVLKREDDADEDMELPSVESITTNADA